MGRLPGSLLLLVVVAVVSTSGLLLGFVRAVPQVPCYFIFGDSLVDNGNNNEMASLARADYLPYGIDFPDGPTGRFTNGKTAVDVIGELLGFEDYIPPYASVSGDSILRGVNFASAAAGIRAETGRQLGGRTDFAGQVSNYRDTALRVVDILGDEDSAARHLGKCIFTVAMGSNDYLNNYFMPNLYSSGRRYSPEGFADVLIREYSQQLRVLYNYGARKVALIGVGMVGCSPNELARYSSDGATCISRIDNAIQLFNSRLISLVDDFNSNLQGAKFTFINTYVMLRDILRKPSSYGFKVANEGCCGVGRNNGQITCLPGQSPCKNRKEYVFWDAFHPTEAANVIFGKRSYSAQSSKDAYPVDIRQLAKL